MKVSHKRDEMAEASVSEPDTEAELIPRVEDVQMSDSDSELASRLFTALTA